MAKKTTVEQKSKLRSWFLSAPAKFSALLFVLTAGITILYSAIGGLLYPNAEFLYLKPLMVLLIAAFVFSIYKLVKWLPKDNLDRRSFVAVDNGLTFIYFIAIILSAFFLVRSVEHVMYYMMWLQYYSVVLFFVTLSLASLIYLYVLGLLISNIYAIYRRALGMGIPKWKALLSFPFTLALIWMPGYLLPEEKKTKPVITIKSNWYAKFTDWVVAKPVNAVMVLLFTLLFTALFLNVYSACLTLFFAVIFGVWIWISGAKNFRKKLSTSFATFAASLNIAMLIVLIGFAAFGPKTPSLEMQTIQYEEIQITETVETPEVAEQQ